MLVITKLEQAPSRNPLHHLCVCCVEEAYLGGLAGTTQYACMNSGVDYVQYYQQLPLQPTWPPPAGIKLYVVNSQLPLASCALEFPASSKNQLVRSPGGFQFAGFMVGHWLQALMEVQMVQGASRVDVPFVLRQLGSASGYFSVWISI